MAKRRRFSTFNLSFLDIMSCGFGAVALIFLIIKHDIDKRQQLDPNNLQAEVNLLHEDIRAAEALKVRAKNTLSELDQELVEAQGLARRINDDIEATRSRLAQLSQSDDAAVEQLRREIERLEARRQALQDEARDGQDLAQLSGAGNRQYLTGLKLGGRRIVILLDASASMLDETLINIIRRRNMAPRQQRQAAKWQRALATVQWLVAKFPVDSQYQIYLFNTEVKAALKGSRGRWLAAGDRAQLQRGLKALQQVTPQGGTSLHKAFASLGQLGQKPDNVFLITDGLPTQGFDKPRANTIDGNGRMRLFNSALEQLPSGFGVNVILAPMEGDPLAAAAFWKLAQQTRGSFMSPSKDWP